MGKTFSNEYSEKVVGYLSAGSLFQEWLDLRQILLERLAEDEPWMHALPILCCQAVGGELANAIPVAAAWTMMYHAGNIIDEVQDGKIKPASSIKQSGIAVTTSIGLIFAAIQMLNACGLEEGVRNRIVALFSQSGFDSSLGQYQITALSGGRAEYSDPLENYWISVILKSGSIYRAGAAGGAVAGSGSSAQIDALSDYGIALGVIRQVIDDCHDILIDRTGKTKKATLPTLLYELVRDQRPVQADVSDQAVRHSTGQPSERASKSLADAGIPEIIADILLEWRRRAIWGLQVLEPSPAKNDLVEIIEHVLSSKSILS